MGAGPIALNIRFDAVMFPGPDGKMRKLGTMVLGGPCEGPCEGPCSTRPRRAGMVVTPRERTTRAVCAGFIDPSTSQPVNQSISPPVHPHPSSESTSAVRDPVSSFPVTSVGLGRLRAPPPWRPRRPSGHSSMPVNDEMCNSLGSRSFSFATILAAALRRRSTEGMPSYPAR